MPLQILQKDITQTDCECIVDPTDPFYSGSGGTDLCIHSKAGSQLDLYCRTLPPVYPGEVIETPAFQLKARYILHTVGPIWKGGGQNESTVLRSCYLNALLKAAALGCESVAFPLISAETFGFPKNRVLRIAIDAVTDFFAATDSEPDVTICVPDKSSYVISEADELHSFLDFFKNSAEQKQEENYAFVLQRRGRSIPSFDRPAPSDTLFFDSVCASASPSRANSALSRRTPELKDSLSEWIARQDDGFAVTLLRLIDKKGMTDVQCYKKSNISRKTFYKINNDKNYKPSKQTVLSFAIGLELTLEETNHLLQTVGFSLSKSSTFDLIIEFFITRGIFDIHEINAALYQYDQPCLGC